MQLITRVLFLAVGIFSACIVPHQAEDVEFENGLLRMVVAQMRSSMMDTRGLSPSGTACANSYNNDTSKIGSDLTNSTGACEDAANRTTVANAQNSNVTVATIRSQQLILEQNLQQCRNLTDNLSFLNCTVTAFDRNLQLLDSSNTLAYQTLSQYSSNATIVADQRTYCIRSAISQTKTKSIQAANDFDHCLEMAKNQREHIAVEYHALEHHDVDYELEDPIHESIPAINKPVFN